MKKLYAIQTRLEQNGKTGGTGPLFLVGSATGVLGASTMHSIEAEAYPRSCLPQHCPGRQLNPMQRPSTYLKRRVEVFESN